MFLEFAGIDIVRVIIDAISFSGIYYVYYNWILSGYFVSFTDSLMRGAEAGIAQIISELVVKNIPFLPDSLQTIKDQAGVDVSAAALLGVYNMYASDAYTLSAFLTTFSISLVSNIVGQYVEEMFYHPSIVGQEEASIFRRRRADKADKKILSEVESGSAEGRAFASSVQESLGEDRVLA